MICPHCQTDNPDTERFCRNCGQKLFRKCPNCQAELPPEARFCMECGQPLLAETSTDADRLGQLTALVPGTLIKRIRSASKAVSHAPGSLREQRTVTTLFADVVGSRALSKKMGEDTWTGIMCQSFELIAPIIYRYEGTLVRLLDDSLLAFMGAPVAHEDDAQRAVSAGLDIISKMKEFAQEINTVQGVDFAMRVCINTGPVEIGPVGEDLTFEYNTSEETVNLTTRLKFASQSMDVLVTANTYKFISPYFDCDDLGLIDVKGMPGAQRVYRVTAARTVIGKTRGFTDLTSPMVGRDGELATLMHLCEAVRAGLGRGVLIVGEPGLGKTRLIQEWRKKVEADHTILTGNDDAESAPPRYWVTGRCTSYGQGVAYHLIIDVIRNMMGVTVGSDEPETHAALINLSHSMCGDLADDIYPYLGHLLSLKLEGEAAQRVNTTDPQALQMQYLHAVQQLLRGCMERNPLIMVLEDLHWADAASIELFIKLLPLVSNGSFLLCLVSRPERNTPGWKLVSAAHTVFGGSLTEISLNPLTEKDSRVLVSHLLELESLPKRVRDLVLRKAEGNPYFVEEVIRMLIERGAIVRKDGAWVAEQEISTRDIPDNLQGLLMARIDQLPAEARYTLMVASVIGRNFPVKVLSQIMGGE
ncbi:MAG TPA: AAA family ATPase [Anaerolineales bacterium]